MEATQDFTIFDAIQEPQSAPSLNSAQAMAIYELLCSYEVDTEDPFVIFTHDQWWQQTLKVSYERQEAGGKYIEYVDPYYVMDDEPILRRILRDDDDKPYTLRRGPNGWEVVGS
jgi:hypothetical protein